MDNAIKNNVTFESIIKDVMLLDNIMLSVRSEGAVAEIKIEKGLPFRVREQWATLGDENHPWHLHVNIEETKTARFIAETTSSGRKSYSIRFFNSKEALVLRINFMKMYNHNNELLNENLSRYKDLYSKYGRNDTIYLGKPGESR
ncbi:MAG: hemin-degrading factor [Thermoproteota archaeon]|nr:hemin-degrading factor [Thermoproteota archaeon]